MELVVLIHGLMRTRWSMKRLERFFIKNGYHTLNISYASLISPIPDIALTVLPKLINKKIVKNNEIKKIHFVTHSLGGIIVRYYFSHLSEVHTACKNGKIIMIAPPNQGSELAQKWRSQFWFKYSQGPAGQALGTDAHAIIHQLKPLKNDTGIIAGNRSNNPVTSYFLPSINDGIVTVASTKLPEMKDHITLPYSHTFICDKKKVRDQILYFLKESKFQHKK